MILCIRTPRPDVVHGVSDGFRRRDDEVVLGKRVDSVADVVIDISRPIGGLHAGEKRSDRMRLPAEPLFTANREGICPRKAVQRESEAVPVLEDNARR